MLEVLCKRKIIRDFLKQYSTEAWPQIIPYICEIAIFNLQNSFGTLMFSKDDFKNIIHNLKHPIEEGYTKVQRKRNVYDNQLYRTEYVPQKPKKRTYINETPQRFNQTFSHSSSKYKNVPSKIKQQVDLDRQHHYEMTHKKKKSSNEDNNNNTNQYQEEMIKAEDGNTNKITTQFKSKTLQNKYNEDLRRIPKINSLTMSSGSNTINSNNMNSNEIPIENVDKNENELTFKNTTIDNTQMPRQNDNIQFNTAPQEENNFQLSNYSVTEQTKNIFKQTMK